MVTQADMPLMNELTKAYLQQAGENKRSGEADRLKQFLQGQQEQSKLGQIKAQSAADVATEQGKSASDLQGLKNLRDAGLGADTTSAQVGGTHIGMDPTAKLAVGDRKGEEAAYQKAQHVYMSGLPKLQQTAQAASEGLDFTNDPKNIGSLGQARTLMLKSMGMNRYNENEAKAVLPPTLYGAVANVFNAAGGDAAPLTENQRQNINQFFKTQLDGVKSQHDMLKQNALQNYSGSTYSNPQRAQMLGQTMGAPMESALSKSTSRYQAVPQTQGPNLTPTPNPGMVDKLKDFLGYGKKPAVAAPVPQAAPAQSAALGSPQNTAGSLRVKHLGSGQTGTIPASEYDPSQYQILGQ